MKAASCCVVCAAALPPALRTGEPLDNPYRSCQAVACRMVVSRRGQMGEPGFQYYLALQARHRREMAALAAAKARKELSEGAENAAGWRALRARLGAGPGEALQLLLPTGPRRARTLSAGRYQRYRSHLQQMAAQACALPSLADVPRAIAGGGSGDTVVGTPTTVSSMPGQLCALCGGGCCTKGGEQAYLSAATMRRFMDAWPRLAADEVVAAYLERVPAAPQERSCINHTGNGCALPREMRSDICNRFHCEPLARLQVALRAAEPVQVVLVLRRKQDHWRRAEPGLDNAINARALLREAGVERISAGTRP